MSVLAGRFAVDEGALFNSPRKQQDAAIALKQKLKKSSPGPSLCDPNSHPTVANPSQADALCRLLPIAPNPEPQPESASAPASLTTSLKLTAHSRRGGHAGGLREGVASIAASLHSASTPQRSLARKKLSMEATHVAVIASSAANCGRDDMISGSAGQKMAAMEGYSLVKNAVTVATGLFSEASVVGASRLGILTVDGSCTRGRQDLRPRVKRAKPPRFEPASFWLYCTCLLLCWLAAAFFLHWETQRWVYTAMVAANPQRAFPPGGLGPSGGVPYCSFWPTSGLGCQFSFATQKVR